MSGSTARQARQAGERKAPEVILLGDLTLDELDEVEALHREGKAGRTVGTVYVWRRRRNPAYTLDEARKVTAREVRITDDTDDELGEGPTNAP